MKKTEKLRELLRRDRPILTIGAHNGLSARIGERAGFDAIWASGFEISSSHAVPDANVLTLTENLEAARSINGAVDLPVIADTDSGYGNAINVQRMVRLYEDAGIAGVSIEDNTFPKRCSFYEGVTRKLASRQEHAGKIRAAVASRRDRDFLVIARTEALIAGLGMAEARARAEAYADAKADAILVHSKIPDGSEVFEFARGWDRDIPLVAVPTKYSGVDAMALFDAGFRVVIFANYALRSAVRAMSATLGKLRREMRAAAVEDDIAPLSEIFDLVELDELQRNEERYLPAPESDFAEVAA